MQFTQGRLQTPKNLLIDKRMKVVVCNSAVKKTFQKQQFLSCETDGRLELDLNLIKHELAPHIMHATKSLKLTKTCS